MRSLALGIAIAFLTVACSDDDGERFAAITGDSGLRDAGGSVFLDSGPLDARAPLDARPGDGNDASSLGDGAPPACARTDEFEPNNSTESASPLTLDGNGKVARNAVVHETNPDWYVLVTPKSDPVSITVSYQVPESSTENLQLYVNDALNTELASDVSQRINNAQLLAARFQSVSAGSYFARVEATTSDCVDYALSVDTRTCTDALEDNDVVSAAALLPSGAQSATVSSLDQDIYTLPSGLDTGSCSVVYSVAADSTQQLKLGLYDASNAALDTDLALRTGTTQTLTVSFQATDSPKCLVLSADVEDCTSYTITCSGS